MKKNLVIIATDYPHGFGEPFLEGELAALSERFPKIFIVLPEQWRIDRTRQVFPIPESAEVIYLDNKTTLVHKAISLFSIFTSRLMEHLSEIRSEYKLSLSLAVVKSLLAYEAKKFSFTVELLKTLKERNISVEQTCFYTCWLTEYTFALALLKKEYPQTKVVSRMHGWDVYFERHSPPYLPYRKFILQNIDFTAAISENGRQYILNKIKDVSQEKVKTFRLGVEGGTRKKKYQEHPFTLLTLSFIRPVKQMELLIEALSKINIELVWHHVGGEEGDYPEKIKSLARQKLSPKRNVKYFFHGTLEKKLLYEFLSNTNIDLIVNASVSEGLPVSIMEAFAHGIPALAPRVGGIPEIIEHGINGFLMSSTLTADEIAASIIEFSKLSAEAKSRLRENAFNTWNEKFNMEKNHWLFAEAVASL